MQELGMRIIVSAIACALIALPGLGQAQVHVAGQIGDFSFALGNYYRVPEREVIVIRERRVPDHEIPVVLFLAERARATPATIVDMRLSGRKWMDISVQFGLSPEVFYVPVTIQAGPPYGKAFGHYKKKKRDQWRTIVLDDDDIVNLVNLRFLSNYHHRSADEVVRLRGSGADFVAIHTQFAGRRGVVVVDDNGPGKGKSKGKGSGKGNHR
jgi:hypothetical protein